MRRPIKVGLYFLISSVVLGLTPFVFLSCSKCSLLPDVNVTANSTTGNVAIEVKGLPMPKSGSPTDYKSIVFDGRVVSNAGANGLGTFHLAKTFEIMTNSINPQPAIIEQGLKTGTWEVKVTSDNWSATATGSVNKDSTTSYVFTYNSQNVEVR